MLETPGGGSVELRGVSFVQKCVEEHRVVFLFASSVATAPAANGPTFREKGWIMFSRSSDLKNSLFPSVAQTCQQIFSDQGSGSASALTSMDSVLGPDWTLKINNQEDVGEKKKLREFILAALVSRTQFQYHSIINFLLANVGRVQIARNDVSGAARTLACS